jgi:hypothetical protein
MCQDQVKGKLGPAGERLPKEDWLAFLSLLLQILAVLSTECQIMNPIKTGIIPLFSRCLNCKYTLKFPF